LTISHPAALPLRLLSPTLLQAAFAKLCATAQVSDLLSSAGEEPHEGLAEVEPHEGFAGVEPHEEPLPPSLEDDSLLPMMLPVTGIQICRYRRALAKIGVPTHS
jgi:hypothetical protein